MMNSYIVLFCALSLCEPLSAAPVLDLPRELVMDVNKPPYPVVNIIADPPAVGISSSSQSMRLSALQMGSTYKEQAHVELEKQTRQLERLTKLAAGTSNRASETLPVVNIRLGAPKNPMPEVAAEIAALEQEREHLEAEFDDTLQAAFDAALASAKSQINKMVAASMHFSSSSRTSFLQTSEPAFAIKVSTVPVPVPDASIKGVMDKIEAKRNDAEKKMLEQACSEMQGLTAIVLNELGAQMQTHAMALQSLSSRAVAKGTGFLAVSQASKALPEQANVRVEAGAPFPTIAGMVQDMETRRDNAESQEASKVLEMELKLLQEENAMIKSALSSAIQRITA